LKKLNKKLFFTLGPKTEIDKVITSPQMAFLRPFLVGTKCLTLSDLLPLKRLQIHRHLISRLTEAFSNMSVHRHLTNTDSFQCCFVINFWEKSMTFFVSSPPKRLQIHRHLISRLTKTFWKEAFCLQTSYKCWLISALLINFEQKCMTFFVLLPPKWLQIHRHLIRRLTKAFSNMTVHRHLTNTDSFQCCVVDNFLRKKYDPLWLISSQIASKP